MSCKKHARKWAGVTECVLEDDHVTGWKSWNEIWHDIVEHKNWYNPPQHHQEQIIRPWPYPAQPFKITVMPSYIYDVRNFTMKWSTIDRGKEFNPSTRKCLLCLKEKFHIIFHPAGSTLNTRSELFSTCRHRCARLLSNSWTNDFPLGTEHSIL